MFFPLTLRGVENIRHDEVEQIQGIIHREDFAGMRKGQQRGEPAVGSHPGNGLRPCRRAIPGEIPQAIRRQMVEREITDSEGADLVEAVAGGDQSRAAHACWGAAQAIQRT